MKGAHTNISSGANVIPVDIADQCQAMWQLCGPERVQQRQEQRLLFGTWWVPDIHLYCEKVQQKPAGPGHLETLPVQQTTEPNSFVFFLSCQRRSLNGMFMYPGCVGFLLYLKSNHSISVFSWKVASVLVYCGWRNVRLHQCLIHYRKSSHS